MLWELFRKFGFLLFQKNVRNPLLQSQFNTDIERTAIEDPSISGTITTASLQLRPITCRSQSNYKAYRYRLTGYQWRANGIFDLSRLRKCLV